MAIEQSQRKDERPMQYSRDVSAFDSKKSFNVKAMSKSPAPKKRRNNDISNVS